MLFSLGQNSPRFCCLWDVVALPAGARSSPKWVYLFTCLFFFLWPHLWHMEVPRLGAELELQLPAYTTATATQNTSLFCNVHHSSRQCQILNPLSEAMDQTCVLMDTSRTHFH